MSQTENAVTSSSGTKRTYRKGNPVPARERQRASLGRGRNNHKSFHSFIEPRLKERLRELWDEEGIMQSTTLEKRLGQV
ncbi:replication regulatory protein RepA, partial [Escherichia coli]|nr:replication regulatory protein RepA [Escherichia coli]